MIIKQVVSSTEASLSWYGDIIKDIKASFARHTTWKLQHVKRNGNWPAHLLVKEALKQDTQRLWLLEIPVCITECTEKNKLCMKS